jgi:hypothetical protein
VTALAEPERQLPELLPPLDTLPPWTGQWRTLGWEVATWIMDDRRPRFLVPDGEEAGAPLKLTERQLTFFLHWYAVDDDGEFIYSGCSMRQPRGTGKSPTLALKACCELVGPVRFAGWSAYGEPIGKRVAMPLVQVAAVSEAQTDNTMNYVREWTAKDGPLAREYNLDPGRQIIYVPAHGRAAGGSLRVITSSAATVRGARPTDVNADETGEWTDSNGGTRFRERLGENAAKVRGARVTEASNVWTPGMGSVAEKRWLAWEQEQQRGATSGRPWLMDVREAPANTDWSEPDSIREALTITYAGVPWVDPEQFMPTILDGSKPITTSMREFGNLRVSDLSSWVSAQGWDSGHREGMALVEGDEIVLFCDPSETDDATAVVACRVRDAYVEIVWLHEPATDGDVSPAELDLAVRLAFQRYKVLAFFSDVRPMEQLVKVEWPERYGDDLLIWPTKTEAVAYDMRRNQVEFAQAAELTAAEVEAGEVLHATDAPYGLALNRHVYNTQRRPHLQYVSVGKGDHSRKIDASVAMIGARMVRRKLIETKTYMRYRRKMDRIGSGDGMMILR